MATLDRRSGVERRKHERQTVSIDVEWETSEDRHTGTVSDLSVAGCFVLSSGDVNPGEIVKLFLPLGDGMKVQVLGEVCNQAYEIGFALNFVETTGAQTDVIAGLMETYAE